MSKTAGITNRVAVWILLLLCVFGTLDIEDYMLILPDYEITEMSPICNHIVYLAGSQPYPFVAALNTSSISVLWKTSPDTLSAGTRIRSIWCHETETAETSGVIIVGDTSDGFNNYKVTSASEGFAASLESTSGRILWSEFVSDQKETSLRALTNKNQADQDNLIVVGVYNSQIAYFDLSTSNFGKSFGSMDIDRPVFSPGSAGSDIAYGNDGSLYLMGYGTSKLGPGGSFEGVRDVFLIKINSATDEVIASWSYGSPFYDECYSIALFEGFAYLSCVTYGDFSAPQSDTIGSGLILRINITDGKLESYYQSPTSGSKTVVYKDILLVNRTLYILGTEFEDGINTVTLSRFGLELNLKDTTIIATSKSLKGSSLSYDSRSDSVVLLALETLQKANGFQYYEEFSELDPTDFSIIRTFFLEGLDDKALSQNAPNATILLDQVICTASITSTKTSTSTSSAPETPGDQGPIRDRVNQDEIPVTLIVVVSVFASLFFAMLVILAWITFVKSKNAGQTANNNIDGFMDSVGVPSTANMTSVSVRNRGKPENTDFTAITSPTVYKEMLQETMPKAAIVTKMNVKNDKSSSSKSNSIEKTEEDKDSSGLGAPTVNLRQLQNQYQESSARANDQNKGKNPAESFQQSAKSLPGENMKAAQSPVPTRSVVKQNEKKSKVDSAKQDSASSNSSFPEKPTPKRDPKVSGPQAPVPLSALLAASKESGQPLESFLPPTKTESTGTNTNVTDIKALRNQKIEQTTLNLSTAVLGSGEVTAPSSRHTNYRAGSNNIPTTPITVATLAIPMHLEMRPKDYAMNKVLLEKHGSVLYVGEGIKDNLKSHGRLLVVKVYRESKSAMSKEEFENFQKEVSIMHHVQEYPYFSKMLGYSTTPVALILKCYSRGSLDHWIFYPKWSKTKTMILSFALDIAEALAVLHKVGIVHFDIKPSSVLLDADESGGLIACLGDFSSAQVADERTLDITSFNATANKEISIPFTSPEQLTRLRGVSEKTIPLAKAKKADVYSYGIVFLQVLCMMFDIDNGKRPDFRIRECDEIPDISRLDPYHTAKRVCLIAPVDDVTVIRDKLSALKSFRISVNLLDFIDERFLEALEKARGSFWAVTADCTPGMNFYCLTPAGCLVLNISKDVFIKFGLEGKKIDGGQRYLVEIDLKSLRADGDSKYRERVMACLKRLFDFKMDMIFSSVDDLKLFDGFQWFKEGNEVQCVNISYKIMESMTLPLISDIKRNNSLHNLLEWAGCIANDCPLNQDAYISLCKHTSVSEAAKSTPGKNLACLRIESSGCLSLPLLSETLSSLKNSSNHFILSFIGFINARVIVRSDTIIHGLLSDN